MLPVVALSGSWKNMRTTYTMGRCVSHSSNVVPPQAINYGVAIAATHGMRYRRGVEIATPSNGWRRQRKRWTDSGPVSTCALNLLRGLCVSGRIGGTKGGTNVKKKIMRRSGWRHTHLQGLLVLQQKLSCTAKSQEFAPLAHARIGETPR